MLAFNPWTCGSEATAQLSLGMLQGNRFEIVLRCVTEKTRVPNHL